MHTHPRPRVVPQRGFSLDYFMWLFTRVSALAIILVAMGGFFGALIMGARTQMDLGTLMRWTFFPNPSHIASSDLVDTDPWITGYWQTMQMLIVFFGVTHGFNGLRMVIEDYLGYSFLKQILRGLIFLAVLFMLIVAIQVILAS